MVAVAILAAGRGTRMKSDLPKVLHALAGRSLVERVLDSCSLLDLDRQIVIIGYQGEKVKQALNHRQQVEFVEQTEQLGTGHAVPTLLTANLPNPQGYGRVFCNGDNIVSHIIEDRDCNIAQKQIRRVNAGIYCFNWQKLAESLPKLSTDNDQQEYYLTEVVDYLSPVMAFDAEDYRETNGINDRQQLSAAYDILQARIKEDWMKAGVTMIDPSSITIDENVQLEPDVILEPQTHLRGNTSIATGSRIGPGSLIDNSQIGKGVTVLYSVVSDSEVAANTRIGPYSHLRGNVKLGESCRVGNFVEIKNTTVGANTNMAHLSYLGDATLGDKVNIGAGTITANYDGKQKHPTTIKQGTKTGSNSVLVAPVTLGENVTVAAGSVVTQNVNDNALVVARSRQKEIPDWNSQG